MREENGIPKILYWIMGAVLTISTTGAAATIGWYNTRVIAVENLSARTAQQAAVNEAKMESLEYRLIRIEEKLDRLLENRAPRR